MAPAVCCSPAADTGIVATSYYPPPRHCRQQANPKQGRATVAGKGLELADTDLAILDNIPSPTRRRARLADQKATEEACPQTKQHKPQHTASPNQEQLQDKQQVQEHVQGLEQNEQQYPRHLPQGKLRERQHRKKTHQLGSKLTRVDAAWPAQETGALSPSSCWEIDSRELEMLERVGVGATAEVYRAEWHGTDVAVKKMLAPLASLPGEVPQGFNGQLFGPAECELGRRLAEIKQQEQQQRLQHQHLAWCRRELALLQELRHPNLVLFMGAVTLGEAPPLIVSEFCAGGTLFRLLHERRQVRLRWPQKLKAAQDTAKGMNFLHRRRVIHRDLKSLNILLAGEVGSCDDPPWVKISDFGLSRRLPTAALLSGTHAVRASFTTTVSTEPNMTGGLGTGLWMAPECLSGHSYDERADVYSYGVVLFELICRRLPFDGAPGGSTATAAALRAVCAGERPALRYVPACCPADLQQIMEHCWAQRPEARPDFSGVLEDLGALMRTVSGATSTVPVST
eukprot:TRINITY_DN2881_c0_g1_i1.p1 TRINITY_DN2881_c0_g1~~TRINITY_DN2881_c0_g1_i1.p1  ORF type:complete len:519 (+),score=86.37 TRINITY_DN2881_c0_g1_i1:24-1559(+)